jgi:hypothetical protein
MFGPKRNEMMTGRTNLHNEELHNLYCPPNIIKMKSRRVRWVGHVSRMGARGFWSISHKERDHYEDVGIGGTILKWVLEK